MSPLSVHSCIPGCLLPVLLCATPLQSTASIVDGAPAAAVPPPPVMILVMAAVAVGPALFFIYRRHRASFIPPMPDRFRLVTGTDAIAGVIDRCESEGGPRRAAAVRALLNYTSRARGFIQASGASLGKMRGSDLVTCIGAALRVARDTFPDPAGKHACDRLWHLVQRSAPEALDTLDATVTNWPAE